MMVSGLQIKQNRKSATTQHVKTVDSWMKRTNDHTVTNSMAHN